MVPVRGGDQGVVSMTFQTSIGSFAGALGSDQRMEWRPASRSADHPHGGQPRRGAAPMPSGEVSRRFAGGFASAAAARRFVAETFRHWGLHHLVDDACLIVSELVTNAVRHARSDIAVALSRISGVVRVAVADADPRPPTVRCPDPDEPGGRGLQMVAALARTWDCEAVPGGKIVWADLALDGDSPPAS